jgi:hypothetical protein
MRVLLKYINISAVLYENARNAKLPNMMGEQIETNLMSLAFLFHYFMLNMFQMLIQPSSGACDLFVELFQWLYCSVRISQLNKYANAKTSILTEQYDP